MFLEPKTLLRLFASIRGLDFLSADFADARRLFLPVPALRGFGLGKRGRLGKVSLKDKTRKSVQPFLDVLNKEKKRIKQIVKQETGLKLDFNDHSLRDFYDKKTDQKVSCKQCLNSDTMFVG